MTNETSRKKRLWLGKTDSSQLEKTKVMAEKVFEYDELILKDHQIFSKQVLMGVAYLSTGIDYALTINQDDSTIAFDKVVFSNAVKLEFGQKCRINVENKEKRNTYELTVRSHMNDGSSPSVVSTQKLHFSEEKLPAKRVDPSEKFGECVSENPGSLFYSHPEQCYYGDSLFSVNRVGLNGDMAFGEFTIDTALISEGNDYYIHPAVFDAAHVTSSYCLGDEPILFHRVPLLIKKVFIDAGIDHHTLNRGYCEVHKKLMNEEIAEFDIVIYNDDGIPVVCMEGFTTKKIPSEEALFGTPIRKDNSAEITDSRTSKKVGTSQPMAIKGMDLKGAIDAYLKRYVAELLEKTIEEVSSKKNFMDLGLDSNHMLSLVKSIEDDVDIELYPTLFFEKQNIFDLCEFFVEEHASEFSDFLNISDVDDSKNEEVDDTPKVSVSDFNMDHQKSNSRLDDIAIVGMSAYLPDSSNLDEFWEHLKSSDDLVREIPDDRWDHSLWFDRDRNAENKAYSKWGGFIDGVDQFDSGFFGISSRMANWMDPQLRLLLQSAYTTFEDAGVINTIKGTATGVYVGCCFQEYWDEIIRNGISFSDYQAHSAAMSSIAGNVSYHFDLQGPAIPLDNACASSLTALHLGCQAIRNGECKQALIAGVNLILSPLHYVYFSRLQALSPTGRCRSFDASADGYVPGEGVVSVLIKPLKEALKDGNNIHGIVKGSAINHVGRANNPYSPRPELQTSVIQSAWKDADIDPAKISYIEAHGTGTELGDPIEINALKQAFKPYNVQQGSCAIGSAKAHMGHLEGAAGLASIIKVLLMLKNKSIPKMPQFKKLNPYINFSKSPLYINEQRIEWDSPDGMPRLAGISSFGMTGNNAHVVIEEYTEKESTYHYDKQDLPFYIPISAKSEQQLTTLLESLVDYLDSKNFVSHHFLKNLAFTYQVAREQFKYRVLFVVEDQLSLREAIVGYLKGEPIKEVVYAGMLENESHDEEVEAISEEQLIAWHHEHQDSLIAEAWMAGKHIPWTALSAAENCSVISAPTYPFKTQRHWMHIPQNIKLTDTKLHPLLHSRDPKDSNALCSTFNGSEYFLAHHQVQGTPVLPGAAYVEMGLKAAALLKGADFSCVKNIVWQKPLMVERSVAVKTLLHDMHGGLKYEVVDDQGDVCGYGFVYGNAESPVSPVSRLDIDSTLKSADTHWDKFQVYQYFLDKGLGYGESFQVIEKLLYGKNRFAMAKISLPENCIGQFDEYTLHPSLLDGALQTTVGFFIEKQLTDASMTHLPFSIDECVLHQPLTKNIYAYVTLCPKEAGRANSAEFFNVHLLNDKGDLCVEVKRFMVRMFKKPASHQEEKAPVVPDETLSLAENVVASQAAEVAASTESILDSTQAFLCRAASEILQVDEESILLEEEVSTFGMDSITLTELANKVSSTFGITLNPTIFFEFPTLSGFSEHLCDAYGEMMAGYFAASEEPVTNVMPLTQTPTDVLSLHAVKEPDSTIFYQPSAVVPQHDVDNEDIAIVGMSGEFPLAGNLDDFWENLIQGKNCITEVPASRWDWRTIYGNPHSEKNKSSSKWGGFIDDIDLFDPLFFGVSPVEAELMDPQQRLLMKHTWRAIEDAGYATSDLSGTNTCLFLGTASTGYQNRVMEPGRAIEGYSATSVVPSLAANRISYLLNLHGASEPVETACSSALVAIDRGIQAILLGRSDIALVGGANTLMSPQVHISFSKANMLAPDGLCKTFSEHANGYVRGEGVGILMLKRLSAAERDGDNIYAVIKGSAVNHGGRANSLTAPNTAAQTELLLEAYRKSDIPINSVGYVEAHGTGTALGDPVEVNALKQAFSQLAQEQGVTLDAGQCGIGSVKSNIGHLELAAGVAGIIKAVLAIKHRELPPTLHCDQVNEFIQLEGSPFFITQEGREWQAARDADGRELPLRSGVSSFGFGGVNAHIVLEEYCPQHEASSTQSDSEDYIFVFSARTEEDLQRYLEMYRTYLVTHGNEILPIDFAYTLQLGRDAYDVRKAVVADSISSLIQALESGRGVHTGMARKGAKNDITIHSMSADEIAQHWVNGDRIMWQEGYQGKRVKRLHIPTYPYAEKRYWLEQGKQDGMAMTGHDLLCAAPEWRDAPLSVEESRKVELSQVKVILLGQASELEQRFTAIGAEYVTVPADKSAVDLFLEVFNNIKRGMASAIKPFSLVIVSALDLDDPELSAIASLIKTAKRESPHFQGKVVTFPADLPNEICIQELTTFNDDIEVRYTESNHREHKRFIQVNDFSHGLSVTAEGGVYWITGGLGGLGLHLATYYAQAKDVKLILSGRSDLTPASSARLETLQKNAQAEISYVVCDVSDLSSVTNAYASIKDKYGKLNGIIHSAGVIEDAFILKKTEAQIRNVYAPKVSGIHNLDHAIGEDQLDYMVLFSSLSSALGSAGQADYAGANGYLDGFSRRRNQLRQRGQRSGFTLSVNWPLWADGGMQVDDATAAMMKRTSGLIPMPTQVGLIALERALASGLAQCLVLYGEVEKIKSTFDIGEEVSAAPAADQSLSQHTMLTTEPLAENTLSRQREQVVTYMKSRLAEVLKLTSDQIDEHALLEKYGIDSVMILSLTTELEKVFGKLPSTLFFEYQTLSELCNYFIEQHSAMLSQLINFDSSIQGNAAASHRMVPPAVIPQSIGRTPVHTVEKQLSTHEPIAIVGISGRYPQADDLDAFWENLKSGKDCITDVPPSRWRMEAYPELTNKGGFINGVDEFDPMFFNISPREAEVMDPQERLFLQCAWSALEDGGYTRQRIREEIEGRVGVYVGVMYEEYQHYGVVSNNPATIANRVSYFCDLHGPSMVVDTMCSSSLTSIHLACESLRLGECRMALAGGVNVTIHPQKYQLLKQGNFLSSTGTCQSFGEGGDGYIPGEGVGCVVLKPLSAAIADNDQIYGVIKNSALNHGGKTNGYTVPNPVAQASVISAALQDADIDPREISYIEAHGTGTSLGDPIEIRALNKAYALDEDGCCAIGSVKSNIGHCESAAGIAALTKVLYQIKHRQLVPSLHSEVLNPNIDFSALPFKVQQQLSDWQRPVVDGKECPRTAGISSFGAGGSNAHLIVSEYVSEAQERVSPANGDRELIVLSAHNEERLKEYAQTLLRFIQRSPQTPLSQLAYTLQCAREAFDHRVAFVVSSTEELETRLAAVIEGNYASDNEIYSGVITQREKLTNSLDHDEDFPMVVESWLSKRKLALLARAWVSGLSISWQNMYPLAARRIVSSPTYPFARESYWIESNEPQDRVRQGGTASLHPLIDENISTFNGQAFSKLLYGSEFYLMDHIVGGNKVLPAAACIEMFYAAMKISSENSAIHLQNLHWANPIIHRNEELGLKVEIDVLEPNEDSFICHISNVNTGAVYCQAEARVLDASVEHGVDFNPDDVRSRMMNTLSGTEHYRMLGDQGLEYGISFRCVQEIAYNDSEALSELVLPNSLNSNADDFYLHPSIIDSVFQSVSAVLSEKGNSYGYVPYRIDSITTIQTKFTKSCLAYVSLVNSDTDAPIFDFLLADEKGQALMKITGLHLRRYEKASLPGEVICYAPEWETKDLGEDLRSENRVQVLMIGSQLQLTERLQQEGIPSLTLSDEVPFEALFIRVFQNIQNALKADDLAGSVMVLVCPQTLPATANSAFASLFKTARRENPNFRGKIISLTEKTPLQLAIKEISSFDGHDEVRYLNDQQRQVKVLTEVDVPLSAEFQVEQGGVYWITGGLGGLGTHMAELYGRIPGATVILSGRSELQGEKRTQFEQIKAKASADIVYLVADVSNRESVEQAYAYIKHTYGTINSVIHSAGIIHDEFILKKSEAQIKDVFAPKVSGIQYLDEVIGDDDLDSMVIFSSLASALGSMGQADYAAANGYLDAFAELRNAKVAKGMRSGRTVSINWPLWLQGGMHVDSVTEEMMYNTLGILPLPTSIGLDAYRGVLSASLSQCLVMYGNVDRIAHFIETDYQLEESNGVDIKTNDSGMSHLLYPKTVSYLKELLSSVIKLKPEKMADLDSFEKYGIDSVMVLELTSKLEKVFSSLPKTLFFECQNISELANYFIANYQAKLESLLGIDEPRGMSVEKDNQEKLSINSEVNNNQMRRAKLERTNVRLAREDSCRDGQFEQIAIIGVSGRYPMAEDVAAFWENLKSGVDCITDVPKSRWNADAYSGIPGKGGFIDGVDQFDPLFFNISPREAEFMEPQERLFLQCAWSALENSGYTRERLKERVESRVGVYVGVMYEEYQHYGVVSNNPASIANRVSYFCDLRGPSMVVDTMCSSSLTTVHLACESLRNGDCGMALAGGVNISIHPQKYQMLNQGNFLSSTGACQSFGVGGDGYIPGEGVGCVVLKPLSAAVADNDHIYGVIKGSALNHGGKTNGYTVPNPSAQADVIGQAIRRAGIDSREISYVEAHGTGTSLGDPIEISALNRAYGLSKEAHCAIGSVKSNIGHCESAAGIAALTKVLCQFEHRQLVPSLHSKVLNPNIDFEESAFAVQQSLEEWERPVIEGRECPRTAGVSSFGAGGSNAHLILSEYMPFEEQSKIVDSTGPVLVVISAQNETRLKAQVEKLMAYLRDNDASMEDVAYTLQQGRESMNVRLAFATSSREQCLEILHAFLSSEPHGYYQGNRKELDAVGMMLNDSPAMITQMVAQGRDLDTLAKLWATGVDIRFSEALPDSRGRIIDLPTYAFATERYWINRDQTVEETNGISKPLKAELNVHSTPISAVNNVSLTSGEPDWLALLEAKSGRHILIIDQSRSRITDMTQLCMSLAHAYQQGSEKAGVEFTVTHIDDAEHEIHKRAFDEVILIQAKADQWIANMTAVGSSLLWDVLAEGAPCDVKNGVQPLYVKPDSRGDMTPQAIIGSWLHAKEPVVASMSMLHQVWKREDITSIDPPLSGLCLILVNAYSESLLGGLDLTSYFSQAVIRSAPCWDNPDSAVAFYQQLNGEFAQIDHIVDLTDLHNENQSYEQDKIGQVAFYQQLVMQFKPINIVHVTKNLQACHSETQSMSGSKIVGLLAMLSSEYSHLACKSLDIDGHDLSGTMLLSRVVNESAAGKTHSLLCYRNGVRYVPEMETTPVVEKEEAGSSFQLRKKGTYLITGGTSGIGLNIAKHFAEQGAGTLALMGVTELPDRNLWEKSLSDHSVSDQVKEKLTEFLKLENLGATVIPYSGSLTDRAKLSMFIQNVTTNYGEINGVVHSAGAMKTLRSSEFAFAKKELKSIAQVLEPKIDGVETLSELLQGQELDFFVTFSSTSGKIPRFAQGMSDYGLANMYFDYFTQYQNAHGYPIYHNIAWVGWLGTGSHSVDAAFSEQAQSAAAEYGLLFNDVQSGIALFDMAMSRVGNVRNGIPCLLNEKRFNSASAELMQVSIADVAKAAENVSEAEFNNLIRRLTNESEEIAKRILADLKLDSLTNEQIDVLSEIYFPSQDKNKSVEVAQFPEKVVAEPKSTGTSGSLKEDLKMILAEILKVDAGLISQRDSFQEFGLDSISGTQYTLAIKARTGLDIPTAWLVEYPSIELLGEKIAKEKAHV